MDKFLSFLKELDEIDLFIVEGKRDKEVFKYYNVLSLEEFSFNFESLISFLEDFKGRIIILTDNDRKGKILYKRIKEFLLEINILDDELLRVKFFKFFNITHIEELRGDINGKTLFRCSEVYYKRNYRSKRKSR